MTKIIGIGNALVDVLNKLESDELLEQLGLPKGSMQLVDEQKAGHVKNNTKHLEKEMASGGSAANTINGLAKLGVKTAFVGTVGNDETGKFFSDDLLKNGVEPRLNISNTPSGIAHAMISKDGERTFGTFLGASIELSPDHIKPETFKGYDLVHVEGYLVQNHALLEKILKTAKEQGLEVSLDLASYNVVEDNLDFLKEMVKKYVDIVFANEEEAKAFTGKEPAEALDEIAGMVKIAVVKIGSEGSLVKSDGKVVKIEPQKVDVVDTTGAGDLFAAGFLYGYVNHLPFEEAGRIGTMLASKVITGYGAKLNEKDWKEIKEKL